MDFRELFLAHFPPNPPPDPFKNDTRLKLWSKIKLFLFGPITVTIRLLSFAISVILFSLLAFIATIGLPKRQLKPFSKWREYLMRTGTRPTLMLELFGLGVWNLHIEGKQNLAKNSDNVPIIVTNHIAVLDPVVTAYTFRLPAQITKIDNLNFPLMSMVVRGSQSLCVDREARESRSEVQKAILTRTTEPGWPPLLIYPEGVCSNGEAILEFKTGAFIPGQPIQPVAISYPYSHFNPSWTNGSAVQVISNVMAQFYNEVHVKILPVYYPTQAEKQDPKLFAEGVRQKIASALGLPMTPCSLIDLQLCQLVEVRQKYKVYTNSLYLVGTGHLLQVFPAVTQALLHQWALDFCSADADRDSCLTYNEFCATTSLGSLSQDESVWRLLCQGDPKLKFRNFVYGCAAYRQMHPE